ncbi:hypothetical protein N7447_011225 [Penicillium robsamsonii]|uniref:uncharacterized protein n=1 Tax=Penicillium robsamsonii TaxID=1792511 RepID=UPI002546B6FD|nr:uncharacterized protein N7447_011225 [Penicillium robsamsonii]KAJ5807313.1 hypothetical protein N7447_011225 [Penicillium robsamsonii]
MGFGRGFGGKSPLSAPPEAPLPSIVPGRQLASASTPSPSAAKVGWPFRAPVRPRRQATERTGEYPKSPYWLPCRGASLLTTWAEGALPDAPRARLRLALLGCLPPARPAISPAAPTGAPTPSTYPAASPGPLSQGRDAPPAAPSPRAWRTKDRL